MIELLEPFVIGSFQYRHRDNRKRLLHWLL